MLLKHQSDQSHPCLRKKLFLALAAATSCALSEDWTRLMLSLLNADIKSWERLYVNGFHINILHTYLENLNDCIFAARLSDDVNPDQTAYSPCLHRYRVPTLFELKAFPSTISSPLFYGKHSNSIFLYELA